MKNTSKKVFVYFVMIGIAAGAVVLSVWLSRLMASRWSVNGDEEVNTLMGMNWIIYISCAITNAIDFFVLLIRHTRNDAEYNQQIKPKRESHFTIHAVIAFVLALVLYVVSDIVSYEVVGNMCFLVNSVIFIIPLSLWIFVFNVLFLIDKARFWTFTDKK